MDHAIRRKIVSILDGHRNMNIATLRPDGWPQTTTVGYANDGLTLYFLCGKNSQKAANLARDDRVSLTIDDDGGSVMEITGVSMAARAQRIVDETQGERVLRLLFSRYQAQEAPAGFQPPNPGEVALFRVTPTVISLLDYSKGFGHADLVDCAGEVAAAA